LNITLWEHIKSKLKAINKARKLQAKEYERRLEALNHEAAQLKDMQATYTPREVFDRTIAELRKEIQINSDWRVKQDGQRHIDKQIMKELHGVNA